jgi:hypothetical protein
LAEEGLRGATVEKPTRAADAAGAEDAASPRPACASDSSRSTVSGRRRRARESEADLAEWGEGRGGVRVEGEG